MPPPPTVRPPLSSTSNLPSPPSHIPSPIVARFGGSVNAMSVRRLVALDDGLPSHTGGPSLPRFSPTVEKLEREAPPAPLPRLPLLSTSLPSIASRKVVASGGGHHWGDGGLPLPPHSRRMLLPPLSVALSPLVRERERLRTRAGGRLSPLPPTLTGSTGCYDGRSGGGVGGDGNGDHTPARPVGDRVDSEAARIPPGRPWSSPDRLRVSILTAADDGVVPTAAGTKGARVPVSSPDSLWSMRSASCSAINPGVTKAGASMSTTTKMGAAPADAVAATATSRPPPRDLCRSSPAVLQPPRSSPPRSSPPNHSLLQYSPPTDPTPRLSPPPCKPQSLPPLFDGTPRDGSGSCGHLRLPSCVTRAVLEPHHSSVAEAQAAAQVADCRATAGDGTGGTGGRIPSYPTTFKTADGRGGSGGGGGGGPLRPTSASSFNDGSRCVTHGSRFSRDGEPTRKHQRVNTMNAANNLPASSLSLRARSSEPDVPTAQLLGLTVASMPSPRHATLPEDGVAADGRDSLPPSAASECLWTLPWEASGPKTGAASQTFVPGGGFQGRPSDGGESAVPNGRERAYQSAVAVSPPQDTWAEQPLCEIQSGPTWGTPFATPVRMVEAGVPQGEPPEGGYPSPLGYHSEGGERICPRQFSFIVHSGHGDGGGDGSPSGPTLARYAVADGGWCARQGAPTPSDHASVEPLLPLFAGRSDKQLGGDGTGQFRRHMGSLDGQARQGVQHLHGPYATDLRGSPEEAASATPHAPVLPALRLDRGGGSPRATAAVDRVNLRASPGPSRGGATSSSPPTIGTVSTPTPCGICGANFTSRCHLSIHIKTVHWGLRPWLCRACGVSFGQKGTLTRHISAVHAKQRPHRCERCSKAFGERWTLRVHVRNVHDRERPHGCELCNKRFGERWNLKKHMVNVHRFRGSGISKKTAAVTPPPPQAHLRSCSNVQEAEEGEGREEEVRQ